MRFVPILSHFTWNEESILSSIFPFQVRFPIPKFKLPEKAPLGSDVSTNVAVTHCAVSVESIRGIRSPSFWIVTFNFPISDPD